MTEEHHNPLQHGVVRDIGGRGSWVPRGLEELRELVSQEGKDGGEEVTGAVGVLGHGRQLQQSSGENIQYTSISNATISLHMTPLCPLPLHGIYNVSHKFPTTVTHNRATEILCEVKTIE